MKEALVLIMLALLLVPLLVGVRRIRRLSRARSGQESGDTRNTEPEDQV